MTRLSGAVLVTVFVLIAGSQALADDKDATAILDKGIKALGGDEKLGKVKAMTWKSKGKLTVNGNDTDVTSTMTVQGLDQFHSEGAFGDNKVVTVIAGDKGWRKFGDRNQELNEDALARFKRTVYLQVIPATLVPLKGKEFKLEVAGEEKVDGKPAAGLKVTGPDKKDFTLFFDKESGLPVKLLAKIVGFGNKEVTQETTFGDYKEVDGIKKATKTVTKHDGEKFSDVEITEFKVLDKVDAKTFEEPK